MPIALEVSQLCIRHGDLRHLECMVNLQRCIDRTSREFVNAGAELRDVINGDTNIPVERHNKYEPALAYCYEVPVLLANRPIGDNPSPSRDHELVPYRCDVVRLRQASLDTHMFVCRSTHVTVPPAASCPVCPLAPG